MLDKALCETASICLLCLNVGGISAYGIVVAKFSPVLSELFNL